MADKTTHFGRAGEFHAMSELLLRGWNVAVPVVDVGDDVFVIDDNDKTTWRLQVKSAEAEVIPEDKGGGVKAKYVLSRSQLRMPQPVELFYMLLIRNDGRWRFLLIPRVELLTIRDAQVETSKEREGPGRPALRDDQAKTDSVGLELVVRGNDVAGWGASLNRFLDRWPEALPPVFGGPGTVNKGKAGSSPSSAGAAAQPNVEPVTPPAEDPARSPHREK